MVKRRFSVRFLARLDHRGPFPPEIIRAKRKDDVETELREEVCAGTLTLRDAQYIIATDWFNGGHVHHVDEGSQGVLALSSPLPPRHHGPARAEGEVMIAARCAQAARVSQ